MTLIVGIDEAGYGPNLGPLVVGASVWTTPAGDEAVDLYEALGNSVCRIAADFEPAKRLPIADSKELYTPGGSLAMLEQAVLAAADLAARDVSSWRNFVRSLQAETTPICEPPIWERDFDLPLPMSCTNEELSQSKSLLYRACETANVQLNRIAVAIIQPEQFNDQAAKLGNKAALLSRVSLHLAKSLITDSNDSTIFIFCDKHGGRKRYAGFLQDVFETGLISVVDETAAESVYRFSQHHRNIEIRFTAKGESQLPVALASMAAKYCREMSMKAFNSFWLKHQPDIRPTAGYPQDAKRFRAEIAAVQKKLGVSHTKLWRER